MLLLILLGVDNRQATVLTFFLTEQNCTNRNHVHSKDMMWYIAFQVLNLQ